MSTLHAYFGGGVVGNDGKFVGEAYAFAKNSLKREFEHAYVTLIKLLGKNSDGQAIVSTLSFMLMNDNGLNQ